jgi:hypothetical protein
MRCLFLALLLLTVSATPAAARLSGYDCQIYFGDDEYTPPEVLEVLVQGQGNAVRKCSYSSGYDLIFRPSWHSVGVCQALKRVLVKEKDSLELMRWEGSEPGFPSVLMMIADEQCPRQDDPRYLVTENVTAGTFKAVVRFWEKVSSSEEGHRILLTALREVHKSKGFCGGLERFESDLRNARLKLTAVRLLDNYGRGGPHLSLDLGCCDLFWSLLVDFKDDQLAVLGTGCTIH